MKAYEVVHPTGFGWWLGQVLPPTTILLLAFVRVDLVTMAFWLPALIAVAWSACSLLTRLFCSLFDGMRIMVPPPRQVLTILFFSGVIAMARMSSEAAKGQALRAAMDIQHQCDARRQCPKAVAQWQAGPGGDGTSARAGRWPEYPMAYHVADDNKSFTVDLEYDIDDGVRFSGGIGMPVRPSE